jgi:hypothetical protein
MHEHMNCSAVLSFAVDKDVEMHKPQICLLVSSTAHVEAVTHEQVSEKEQAGLLPACFWFWRELVCADDLFDRRVSESWKPTGLLQQLPE